MEATVSSPEVLNYDNPALVARIATDLKLTSEDGRALFVDMLRFLNLTGTADEALVPPCAIDEAWHRFILRTQDYRNFCDFYFGKFIDHTPMSNEEMAASDVDTELTLTLANAQFGELSANWNTASASCAMCRGKARCVSCLKPRYCR